MPPAGAPGGRRCRPPRGAFGRRPPRLRPPPCRQRYRPAAAERPATRRPAGPAPARPPVATPAGWSPRPAECTGRGRGSAAPPAWRAARGSTRGRTPRSRSRSVRRTPPRPPRWPPATKTSPAPLPGRGGRPVPQASPATPLLRRSLPVRPARPPASPPSRLSRLGVPGTLNYHQSAQSPDNADSPIHESAGALDRVVGHGFHLTGRRGNTQDLDDSGNPSYAPWLVTAGGGRRLYGAPPAARPPRGTDAPRGGASARGPIAGSARKSSPRTQAGGCFVTSSFAA